MRSERLRILVVDDDPRHLAAADALRSEHEVVVSDEYTKVMESDLVPGAPGFPDIVLTDLLMPAEAFMLGDSGMQFFGHDMPIGFVIAIRAAQAGAKGVVIYSDMSHHDHPMSAALEWIVVRKGDKHRVIMIDETPVIIARAELRPDGAKDWQKALDEILRLV